jgi:predicted lipoprotein with Yx(FWY)xxD motif
MSQTAARLGRLIAVIGVVAILAACTAESDATPEATQPEPTASPTEAATEEPTASPEPTDSPEDSADASVLVAESDLGQILTDADGLTIYYFANDTEGVSNCSGECLANWPPVEADGEPVAGDGVDAELGTFERDDGTVQLTVNGFPAYYFAGDAEAGDTNGQGVSDVWWVFGADGEPIES